MWDWIKTILDKYSDDGQMYSPARVRKFAKYDVSELDDSQGLTSGMFLRQAKEQGWYPVEGGFYNEITGERTKDMRSVAQSMLRTPVMREAPNPLHYEGQIPLKRGSKY